MKQLTCEMCGSSDMTKQDGAYVCQTCGMKYSVEEAKKMMIEGTVDVQGTVKVDNTAFVEKYLANARRAHMKKDWEEVEKYYNMVEQNAPNNMEAVFFSSYGKAMLAMTDNDYFKRQQKFDVLNRSMSVLSDYYEVTTENKEEVLRKIDAAINEMYTVTFVYQRQSANLSGALRAMSASTGTKQWCINLIDSVKKAFIVELKEIATKHDDACVKELLAKYETPVVQPQNEPKQAPKQPASQKSPAVAPLILGILGFVFAWLLAIVGHVMCIIGIVLGVKEYKESGKSVGLVVSIIGEVCAVISSIIGIVSMM